jgi:hypothetical protein
MRRSRPSVGNRKEGDGTMRLADHAESRREVGYMQQNSRTHSRVTDFIVMNIMQQSAHVYKYDEADGLAPP